MQEIRSYLKKQGDDYYTEEGISQSELTAFSYGPKNCQIFNSTKNKSSKAFELGSLVDCLVTEPDKFEEKYLITDLESIKPSGQMLEFTEYLLKLNDPNLDLNYHLLEEAYNKVGFKRDSLDKVMDRFNTEAQEYYNIKFNKDKITISQELYNKAQTVANSILHSPNTYKYFEVKEGIEVLNQPEYFWKDIWTKQKLKAKLDRVIIDHNNKTILPIDIKTTSSSGYNFAESYIKYRYDLQAAVYTEALYLLPHRSEYTILPFTFIVENVDYPGNPYVYECSDKDLYFGDNGGVYNGKKYKGIRDLLKEIQWHKENDKWEYTREVYENNGVKRGILFDE